MFSQDNKIYVPTFVTLTLAVYYIYNNNSVVKQSSASKVGK